MISNPCRWYINGDEREAFIYEGGSTLYHFSPYENKLSKYRDCNIVFFADNEKHALDVLRRLFQFRIDVSKKYRENVKDQSVWDELTIKDLCSYNNDRAIKYLDAVVKGKVKVEKAPTNQIYSVGWATNDTILS